MVGSDANASRAVAMKACWAGPTARRAFHTIWVKTSKVGFQASLTRRPAEIERTASVGTIFIRDSAAQAERAGHAAFKQNRAKPWFPHYGTPEQIAEELAPYLEIGYRHLIANFPAPYDPESMTRFATEVRTLLDHEARTMTPFHQ